MGVGDRRRTGSYDPLSTLAVSSGNAGTLIGLIAKLGVMGRPELGPDLANIFLCNERSRHR